MSHSPENRALSAGIIPTFFYYAIPSLIGLIAITTANLVDGIFVGRFIGSDALAAITLLIPYLTLLFGIALMFAIGGSVRAGKYIGENNLKAASAIFSKSLLATAGVATLFACISLGFKQPLFSALGAPTSLIKQMDAYFSVISWALIIQLITMVLYYFVRADGFPILATSALVTGAVLNILLDAYFIVFLEQGLSGAAYATFIAQSVQLMLLCCYFFQSKRTLFFSWNQRQWGEIFHTAYNGISELINEISVGVVLLLINWLMMERIGVEGVAAFTVVNFLIFLSLMLSYGIADALHLVTSQNFGAQNYTRMSQFFNTAVVSVIAIGALLVVGIHYAHHSIAHWFLGQNNPSSLELATQFFAIIWPIFLINGTNIILSCYLTAIHKATTSAMIASARSLVFPATLLLIFAWLFKQNILASSVADWRFLLALPTAEWLAFFFALLLIYPHLPNRIMSLSNPSIIDANSANQ